jgi:hypothetical protein
MTGILVESIEERNDPSETTTLLRYEKDYNLGKEKKNKNLTCVLLV